jgi:succinate-semialdehyde dehydrogenase/glutarate-semialdehyde dehydrogenase
MSDRAQTITTFDPTDGEPIETFDLHNNTEIDGILGTAKKRFDSWSDRPLRVRMDYFQKLIELIRTNRSQIYACITREMGKPITQSRDEVEKCIDLIEHFCSEAEVYLKPKSIDLKASVKSKHPNNTKTMVHYEPLGVILGIMHWNFPFWQVIRFAVPTILAGNTVIVKHASNVSGCALLVARLFQDAGFPKGVYSHVLLDSEGTKSLLKNSAIKGVSVTASTKVGKEIAEISGSLLKPGVFELGGSDPYIVLADADLELAADKCVTSRLINSGQSCIAAKRFIVEEKVGELFVELVIEQMKSKNLGPPMKQSTDLGPLAREDLWDKLQLQVDQSIEGGARCLLGGKKEQGPGFYYPPTVLFEPSKRSAAYLEEMFGPVATIMFAPNIQEAIALANDSKFGLGAALFSKNIEEAEYYALKMLDAGVLAINDFVRSNSRVPFGGIDDSGMGRDLSEEGIRAFCNVKSIST